MLVTLFKMSPWLAGRRYDVNSDALDFAPRSVDLASKSGSRESKALQIILAADSLPLS
jgi:hypothetical protein